MPLDEPLLHSRSVSSDTDLDPKSLRLYWGAVEACLREVFGKSGTEAREAVSKMMGQMERLSQSARLLIYHDSPLQIAATLAKASHRELTEQELLAFDTFWNNPNVTDRPSREQTLRVKRHTPKMGRAAD